MMTRRTLETAGFFTIAAALHVSAAAVLLPDQVQRGAVAEAPPAALAAGGEEIRAMVSDWETPPEVEEMADLAEPEPMPEPQPQPQPDNLTQVAPIPQPQMIAPESDLARPNLPEPPPPPRIAPAQLDLPDLQEFAPPQIETEPALTLEASARPDPRPKRRAPEAQARKPEPQRQAAPAAAPPAQAAGQGGQASRPGGGSGGASAATRASALAQWSAQIQTCLARQLSRVSGGRGGRVAVNISVGRDGRVQGAVLAGGTGDARVDAQVLRGIQRVRSCPAAPAALTDPSYTFQQPFTIR
ncbi:energy transducer TonB family protein [Paracoccus sp. T5]|uniref:energy transducer TonB family protein n=1 Tax=Paracoccus sp. T5 TaxID=3402161 RepID=UPI003AEA175F